MATTIVTKNSSTAAAVPTAAQLVQGELAVNVADKRLFTEDNGGAIVELGVNPSAEIVANAGIALPDSQKVTFGAGDDLQIYHDGNDSYIDDAGQGSLAIRGSASVSLQNYAGGVMVKGNAGSDTILYHNNAAKLATTSTGINVTGDVTATGDEIVLDSSTQSFLKLDKGSSSNFSLTRYYTAGTEEWRTGTFNDTTSYVIGTPTGKNLSITTGGDISFYEDTGTTAKLFWDASAESLGIGTSSPNVNLEILSGGTFTGAIRVGDSGSSRRLILEQTDVLTYTIGGTGTNSVTRFVSGGSAGIGTERMRIDSSGNLLVGKTADTQVDAGHVIFGTGAAYSSRNGFTWLHNRLSTDGEILLFQKDSTTVGSIGVEGGDLTIGNADTGLQFVNTSQIIRPQNLTTNSAVDAQVSLGQSAYRFKDAYLSGGVYLGGTGAANKLEDYETGTWTPTGVGLLLSSPSGTYTKVGRLVTVTWQFVYPTTNSGSQTSIAGLPFTVGTGYTNGGNQGYVNGSAAVSIAHITAVTTSLLYRTANGGTALTHADFSGATVRGSMTYMTA
jgi:hypothetical protein